MHPLASLCLFLSFSSLVISQVPPPLPKDVKTLESLLDDRVSITYKETSALCDPNVKSFAGYVNLPKHTLQDTNVSQPNMIHTFFWFFESRNDPENAPLAILLNGGPGGASSDMVLGSNGPCTVNTDHMSTKPNPTSFNNDFNLLYVDQPVGVGYSYDTPKNVTFAMWLDANTQPGKAAQLKERYSKADLDELVATISSQDPSNAVISSANAARAIWHFAQTWFPHFPQHKPNHNKVSIWGASYGGKYVPAMAAFFREQNQKIANGTWTDVEETFEIHLDSLVLFNACIDAQVELEHRLSMLYNNVFGIEVIDEPTFDEARAAIDRPGGCRQTLDSCAQLAHSEPSNQGDIWTVNNACYKALEVCHLYSEGLYTISGLDPQNITSVQPRPPEVPDFFQQAHVLSGLGVPVNHTSLSALTFGKFLQSGDLYKPGWLDYLADSLSSGIKVALIFGDLDYTCPWTGGEAVSLALNHSSAAAFRNAGYTYVNVNKTQVGAVRQHSGLSFVRVFNASHNVPYGKPEASREIFRRAVLGLDIEWGLVNVTSAEGGANNYSTWGNSSSWGMGFGAME